METSGATYNKNDRVSLYRCWDNSLPSINILMYYPSTANAKTDDTTIKRCISISKKNGYGSIHVFNIHEDVFLLTEEFKKNKNLVIAWGSKISISESKKKINQLMKNYKLLCFKKLKDGRPSLPTRLPNETKIQSFFDEEE
jgi:hypothetical protein